jgi:hypothetical protein
MNKSAGRGRAFRHNKGQQQKPGEQQVPIEPAQDVNLSSLSVVPRDKNQQLEQTKPISLDNASLRAQITSEISYSQLVSNVSQSQQFSSTASNRKISPLTFVFQNEQFIIIITIK